MCDHAISGCLRFIRRKIVVFAQRERGELTSKTRLTILTCAALLCFVVLLAGVIWASDRALELTDESYYLLSALYPDQVTLYISAQHWLLAPLWSITGSLQSFRLLGAGLLLGSALVLVLGVWHVAALTCAKRPTWQDWALSGAAAGIGALVYVATIAPSPSYNLLASAGTYSAIGFTLLALGPRHLPAAFGLGLLGGAALTICLVNKASAGISVGLLAIITLAVFSPNRRGIWVAVAGLLGALGSLAVLIALQPQDPSVKDSLRGGLDLFRLVQPEPVLDRLIRYAFLILRGMVSGAVIFSVALLVLKAYLRRPSHWLFALLILTIAVTVTLHKTYLGGMFAYRTMAEGIYTAMAVILGLGLWRSNAPMSLRLLLALLLVMPFAATIGTGNSLFTQILVALAPWTCAAAIMASFANPSGRATAIIQGTLAGLLALITVQITTSYAHAPYHLARPLTEQTTQVHLPNLGTIRVDEQTVQFLDQIAQARSACQIADGARYFGLFNVPGVALALNAIPPVTPWLGNFAQADAVMRHWTPPETERIVLAISNDVQQESGRLPLALRPTNGKFQLCGVITIPYSNKPFEIWASLTPSK